MADLCSVVIPNETRFKARVLGINISKVCREALAEEVQKVEKEIGVAVAKQTTPNTTTNGGDHSVTP